MAPSSLLRIHRAARRLHAERHDRFFDCSTDMLFVTSLEGRFLRVNAACTKVLGYSESDLLTTSIQDLVDPEDRTSAERYLADVARGNPVLCEHWFLCADRSRKWLAWSAAPREAGRAAYCVARDRTNFHLDQQALRHANAVLTGILESISDAFIALDRDWKLLWVNAQAERLWMRDRADLLGRSLWDIFPEAVGGPFYRMYHQVMRTGQPDQLEEFYPFAPYCRWFEVHAYPSPDGLSVYFRDTTERRKAEEKIQRALEEKEVLLREVHHRVKNNLQVICSMLRLQANLSTDEGLLQVLRDCRERVMAMAMLHDQLHRSKDLSRIDLGEYLRNLASSMFCSYGVNSAQIELRIEVESITVPVDTAIPCGLIVHELLSNSLRHAFPAGQKGRLWVMLRGVKGSRAELTVCDDGRGYSSSDVSNSRSLGLRLVNLLLEQIEAGVEHATNPGTLNRIVFPVANQGRLNEDEPNPGLIGGR